MKKLMIALSALAAIGSALSDISGTAQAETKEVIVRHDHDWHHHHHYYHHHHHHHDAAVVIKHHD